MRALELKIPPPVIALLIAVAMWLASSDSSTDAISISARMAWGVGLACIGQAVGIAGMIAFRRARATINPLKPSAASALVESSVFRFTRNPMYLGLLLSLAGWGTYLSSALPLVGLWDEAHDLNRGDRESR